jgi:hypothetical protein
MAPSADDLTRLRLMVADPAPGSFSDDTLTGTLERYPLDDSFDFHAAAAEVWGLKAAAFVGEVEQFSSDGKSFGFGSLYNKALSMQKFHAARATALYSEYGSGQFMRNDISIEGKAETYEE